MEATKYTLWSGDTAWKAADLQRQTQHANVCWGI